MRKTFIAFEVEDGALVAHDHPVFTGEIAYDLNQGQEIIVHPELEVREFTSEAEAMTAVNDYMREHVGEGNVREEVREFILLPVIFVGVPASGRRAPRSVKGVQPKKAPAKPSTDKAPAKPSTDK